MQRWKFVPIEKEEHRVHDEEDRRREGGVRETDGTGEEVDMKEGEVKEEDAGEELHPMNGPYAYGGENLADPNDAEDRESEEFVTPVKLDQEEYHPHHDRNEDQVLQNVIDNQRSGGQPRPDRRPQLQRERKHAVLRFLKGERHEGRGDEEDEDGGGEDSRLEGEEAEESMEAEEGGDSDAGRL